MKNLLPLILLIACTSIASSQASWIRINQLGYTEDSGKTAVFVTKAQPELSFFELVDVLNGKSVFRSSEITEHGPYAAFSNVLRLDFSSFQQKGSYYIRCAGIHSPVFVINNAVYEDAADFLLKYMRQQRCGYNPYLKDSCHVNDGFIVDHPALDSMRIDVRGGWHDASDYLQYVTTSANATYQMLFAYEKNPNAFKDVFDENGDLGTNGIPDILDEAKWGLDWLDKMNPKKDLMFNQIADDRDHTKFTLPTLDSVDYGKGKERPVYFITGQKQGLGRYKNRSTGVSSTAAKFASSFALGAMILSDYYPSFCESIKKKAIEAYDFAKSDLGVFQTASNRAPYFYEEDNYFDDMELAAIQLFLLSGEEKYRDEAIYWGALEAESPWMKDNKARHYQWYPFVNLGHYKIAENAGEDSGEQFTGYLRSGIKMVQERALENGFLMGVPYIWCSNNLVVALLTQIHLYKDLTGSEEFDELEAAMRDWLFGCNPWGTSMIVGFPENADFPEDPHSAFTAAFDLPIDGGLIDGPVYGRIFNNLKGLKIYNGDEYADFQSELCVYHDDYGDYSTNEPTMDGTASLSYYFAVMQEGKEKLNENEKYDKGGLVRMDSTLKSIYLVFTGDEYADGGEEILNVLEKNEIKAHFFLTGKFYRNPNFHELIRELIEQGHYLGAHSDQHLLYAPWENRDSLLVSKEEFIRDLSDNYQEMQKFGIEKEDADFFLPPFEWYNRKVSKWTSELGLQLVSYTPGTLSHGDYTIPAMGESYYESEKILQSIYEYETHSKTGMNGFILLMHIGTHPDRKDKLYNRLDELVNELKSRAYEFRRLK